MSKNETSALQALLAQMTPDQVRSLQANAAQTVSGNVQNEKRQEQKADFVESYTDFRTSILESLSVFETESEKFDLISASVTKKLADTRKHLEKLPVFDSLSLTSDKAGTTNPSYIVVFGNCADVEKFSSSRTIDNLNNCTGSVGFGRRKFVNNSITYPELCTKFHGEILSDTGIRGFINKFNNEKRNQDGVRCFSNDLSANLRAQETTTGLRLNFADCAQLSTELTDYIRLENKLTQDERLIVVQQASIQYPGNVNYTG